MSKPKNKHKKKHKLPENYMCPWNPNNMDCNACGGDVCGQKEIPEAEWLLRNRRK